MSLDTMLGFVPVDDDDKVRSGDMMKLEGSNTMVPVPHLWSDSDSSWVEVKSHYEPFSVLGFRRAEVSGFSSCETEQHYYRNLRKKLSALLGLGEDAVWESVCNAVQVLVAQGRRDAVLNDIAADSVEGSRYADGSYGVVAPGVVPVHDTVIAAEEYARIGTPGQYPDPFVRNEHGVIPSQNAPSPHAGFVQPGAEAVQAIAGNGKLYIDPVKMTVAPEAETQMNRIEELAKLRLFVTRIQQVCDLLK